MRVASFLAFFVVLFTSCSRSPMYYGATAEQNRANMGEIRKGMTGQQVIYLMGYPENTEIRRVGGESYEIWFYITKRTELAQSRLVQQNLTPFVFKNEILIGWGKQFYEYLLNIENTQEKVREERRQKYTEDKDEWPSNEHGYVPSPKGETLPPSYPPPKEGESPEEQEIDELQQEPSQQKSSKGKSQKKQQSKPQEKRGPCQRREGDNDFMWWD